MFNKKSKTGHLYIGKTTDGKTFIVKFKEDEWIGKGSHESWDEVIFMDRDYAQFLHDKLGVLLSEQKKAKFIITGEYYIIGFIILLITLGYILGFVSCKIFF